LHESVETPQLVLADGVGATRVALDLDPSSEPLQDLGGLFDASPWDVRIGIAGSQEDGRSLE
jgi:hypothetical protein